MQTVVGYSCTSLGTRFFEQTVASLLTRVETDKRPEWCPFMFICMCDCICVQCSTVITTHEKYRPLRAHINYLGYETCFPQKNRNEPTKTYIIPLLNIKAANAVWQNTRLILYSSCYYYDVSAYKCRQNGSHICLVCPTTTVTRYGTKSASLTATCRQDSSL